MSAETKKPVTSRLSVRALRCGFIVSYAAPAPSYLLQQQMAGVGMSGVAALAGDIETVCPTLDDVNKLVAELLVGTP